VKNDCPLQEAEGTLPGTSDRPTLPPSPSTMQTELAPEVRAVRRVLVVDDEQQVLASLCSILEPAGFAVTATSSIREATAALANGRYDLILTDLYVGDEELGIQLADAARHCEPQVPVVLLTGRPSFFGAQEALRTKVAEIVVKPVDPSALLSTCERTIREVKLQKQTQALRAQNEILAKVLPNAIEAKDPTTCGHAERVVTYTDSLAHRCGLDEDTRQKLRLASLLHDVGKIGIPDRILTKPGALTIEEREVVQTHPKLGYDILEPLEHSHDVRRWVLQHHERWDGKGYPEGIGGEEVDLPGRILIIAEVYDALAEERSYKPAWPHERIASLFRAEAGKHFDPELAHLVADGITAQGRRFWAAEPGLLF